MDYAYLCLNVTAQRNLFDNKYNYYVYLSYLFLQWFDNLIDVTDL